jgi:hypothetical protein
MIFLAVCGFVFLICIVIGVIMATHDYLHQDDVYRAMAERETTNINMALGHNKAIEGDIIFDSYKEIDLYKEFLDKVKEHYEIKNTYNDPYVSSHGYDACGWEDNIVVGKGRGAIVKIAFQSWKEERKKKESEKFDLAVKDLLKKAKGFDTMEFLKQYNEALKELPTDDIETAEKWMEEGKKVYMRPVHPGIPNSEMGKETWIELDLNIAREQDCFEFDYEERINERGY